MTFFTKFTFEKPIFNKNCIVKISYFTKKITFQNLIFSKNNIFKIAFFIKITFFSNIKFKWIFGQKCDFAPVWNTLSCNSKFQSPRFKIVAVFSLSNALKTIKKQSKIVHCFASLVFNGSLGLQLISFRHPTTRNYCTHEKSMPCKETLTFIRSFLLVSHLVNISRDPKNPGYNFRGHFQN